MNEVCLKRLVMLPFWCIYFMWFFVSNFFVFTRKIPRFFVNFVNREAVKKHLVFMSIWASQIENI